jgi:hypothetical protein
MRDRTMDIANDQCRNRARRFIIRPICAAARGLVICA